MIAKDIPKNEAEFHNQLGTEEACREYLLALRWPNGFVCPRCNHDKGYPLKNREKWECASCKYHCSIRAGTVMQGSKKPLVMWFAAIYYMMESKQGFSALGLKRRLSLGSYQTAWTWFQKIRDYLKPDSEPIMGRVEFDEINLGGSAKNTGIAGRGSSKKLLVGCIVECRGRASGRVRMKLFKTGHGKNILSFVRDNVAKGSVIHCDGGRSFIQLSREGYFVDTFKADDKKALGRHLPRIYRIGGLIKRVINGTHMGAVAPWRLEKYFDEYVFRFERKSAASRFELFFDVLKRIIQHPCRTCRQIFADREEGAAGYVNVTGQAKGRKPSQKEPQWWKDLLPKNPWPSPRGVLG
jgi:transposase-like protein